MYKQQFCGEDNRDEKIYYNWYFNYILYLYGYMDNTILFV